MRPGAESSIAGRQRTIHAQPASRVAGSIAVPGDKSISHRAILLSALATGTSEVRGFLASEDCLASLAAMRAMGVQIERPAPTEVRVRGAGLHGLGAPGHDLDMGNAGTAMRLFTGLLSAQKFDSRLIGDQSLMRRPMERVAKPLREMGADVRTHEGTPPVDVRGGRRLHGIDYRMSVASAQVKSAILLAALYAEGATTVTSPAPCRDHSERMLESAGVQVITQGLTTRIEPPGRLESQSIAVPGDFSSAAFFLVAGLLGAAEEGLVLENVGLESHPHRVAGYPALHGWPDPSRKSAHERGGASRGLAGPPLAIAWHRGVQILGAPGHR